MGVKPPLPLHSAAAFFSASAAQTALSSYYSFPSSPSSSPSKSAKALLHYASHLSTFISGSACGANNLWRTHSFEHLKCKRTTNGTSRRRREDQRLTTTVSATLHDDRDGDYLENYDDDELFLRNVKEIAPNCGREQDFAEFEKNTEEAGAAAAAAAWSSLNASASPSPSAAQEAPFSWLVSPDPSWRNDVVPGNVEIRDNSVELPLSLRIIKRKKRWEDELIPSFAEAASESASSAVKKAFSSMVFMIRELQSYTVQMRESLVHKFYNQDLQSILDRVHHDLHASFIWLFQHIFSSTPALMLSVMLLLANFTVHSMANAPAIAAPNIPPSSSSFHVYQMEDNSQVQPNQKLENSTVKTFSLGKTASVNGGRGGGSKGRLVGGATDDGQSRRSSYSTVIPDGPSSSSSTSGQSEMIRDHQDEEEEDEEVVWKRLVDEAKGMQARSRAEPLMDSETLQRMVAPVWADFEPDNPADYLSTELCYLQALAQDQNNPLILANFAQFIYSVLRDIDRAEEYFKKAVGIEPRDPEALSKYANFLWLAKEDIAAAEETYLEAIAADPGNGYHTAAYANFLWSTGGEDTCFPIY